MQSDNKANNSKGNKVRTVSSPVKKVRTVRKSASSRTKLFIKATMVVFLFVVLGLILTKSPNGTSEVPEYRMSVIISEVCSSGQKSLYDDDGDFSDYIELYNTTDEDIDLTGWYLSDNPAKLRKYVIPSCTIKSGEYLIIFASGKNKSTGYIHSNFKLSEGELLSLYSPGLVKADSVTVPHMPDNMSYGRDHEDITKWKYFTVPTPGLPNKTKGFESIEEAAGRKGGPLIVSEAVSAVTGGEDWIEIANISGEDVDLTGWYLSDSFNKPQKWAFPDGTRISANGYLIVYASGRFNRVEGEINATFKLDKYDEEIVISWGNVVMDVMEYGVMRADTSIGIISADDPRKVYYTTPSPGKANGEGIAGFSPQVFFRNPTGQYKDSVTVDMFCLEPGAVIHYTLDGSRPTSQSKVYTGPFEVTSNTTVRAMSVMEGRLDSYITTVNYLINTHHALPIVFIASEPNNFFNGGIYNSIYSDRRRVPVNVTLLETDGSGFSEDATINKHGNMTVFEAKKSMSVNFTETVGHSRIEYDLFPDDDTRAKDFGNFLLRSGGNDWDDLMIKDGVLQTLGATQMDLDYQGFRPCVVYINCQYWGLYNIREKENEEYLSSYYDINEKNVDIISFGHGVHSGSYTEYWKFIGFIRSADLNSADNWKRVESMMDVDNMIDTYLMHIYYSNFDTVNLKWWRENKEGAKWRWFTYDLDYAIYVPAQNNLQLIMNPAGHGVNNYFDSSLIYNLMKSNYFRQRFLERLSSYWPTIFNTDQILTYWYSRFEEIAPEVNDNLKRWNISRAHFQSEAHQAYDFLCRRPELFRQMVKNYFGLSDAQLDKLLPKQTVSVKEMDVLKVIDEAEERVKNGQQ